MLDATSAEEACSDSRLVVAVNGSGKIGGLQKFGHGGLNPELMFEMIEVILFIDLFIYQLIS